MSNKIFCTFGPKENINELILNLNKSYKIYNNKIFILELEDSKEYALTYNLDLGNIKSFPDNTIMVHRKKESRTLYTLNALNELIKILNNGVLNENFIIPWNKYRNSILLTRGGELVIIKTKLNKIQKF